MTFDVYYVDGKEIEFGYEFCKANDWTKKLIYCDIEGFAIDEDGYLFLMDSCGNYEYCPRGMFKIVYHINRQDIEQIY